MTSSTHGVPILLSFFFFNDTATTEIYTLSLHTLFRAPGDLADRGRRRGESPPPAERDPREVHEDGDLDEGPDDGGERLPRRDPEDPDRRRDRELEVVARGREREGRRLLGREPEALGDREGDGEHEEEVEDEGDRDPHDVPREAQDVSAPEGEHHDDGEQEADHRGRREAFDELRLVPRAPLPPDEDCPGREPPGHR